uniref:Uncharacterized protein n=1 Tax=Rhizophora mucronata TaxID=61149 RepID=A0A2P2N4Y1_RHIMU
MKTVYSKIPRENCQKRKE